MKSFHIEYDAWPDGARIKSRGAFYIAAQNEDDAIEACALRWPEMNIIRIFEVSATTQEPTP